MRSLFALGRHRCLTLVGSGLIAAALAVLIVALSATPPSDPSPALAATLTSERPFLFSFDGSDATAGAFTEPHSIAVDNASGYVYVANDGYPESGFVSKFNAEGHAEDFSATGTSSLRAEAPGFSNSLGVAVDNSGRSGYQGDLLVSQYGEARVRAFDPSGDYLWTLLPGFQLMDVSLDAAGDIWAAPPYGSRGITQYENTNSPPLPTGCVIPGGTGQAIDVDANGNLYVVSGYPIAVHRYTKTGACAYTESTLDPSAENVYADQSSASGHVFTVQPGNFEEYDSTGAHLGTYGTSYLSKSGDSIAYNPSKDWVYIVQRYESHPVVAVFGAPVTGTAPAVTETSATLTGAEISTAHVSGKINPEGVASEAHFEWKRSSESWAAATLRQSSPPQALTANTTEQTVEFDTDELRGNTTYEVRLVGVNSANHLAGFSLSPVTITTKKAPEAPAISVEPAGPVGTTTATVNAQINPKGDTADWHAELQRNCAGNWTTEPTQTIVHAASLPVAVHYDVAGLLPSERYCVRISATNSAGTTVSAETKEFTTKPVAPREVETAFVAPRGDTTARLNGRVDPEGEALTYRFEYSANGGVTWNALSNGTDTSEARGLIVLSAELTHLQPDTTYSYRFVAENPAGEASGSVKMFTTRSAEPAASCPNALVRAKQHWEYLADCRGVELVNNPDKGRQNLGQFAGGLLGVQRPDGEETIWNVAGGAPGSPNGANSVFLAHRTATGWQSSSLIPPADEQIGEANWIYQPTLATRSLSRFVFTAEGKTESKLVRLDPELHQEALRSYPRQKYSGPGDISDNGAQVVNLNHETQQLEMVGTGEPAEVVSIMPGGGEAGCGIAGDGTLQGFMKYAGAEYHAMASDGSRVYFQTYPNGKCGVNGSDGIYERNLESHTTRLIDPGPGSDIGVNPEFIRTTTDGRHAYFVTASKLASNDHNADVDVYRWDEEGGGSTCLTCVVADANIRRNTLGQYPVLISNDFSHIYFTSQERLAPGATGGAANIYVLSGGTIRFVAAGGRLEPGNDALRPGVGEASQLSADGNVLVFETEAEEDLPSHSLTSDEISKTCGESGNGTCVEIYRYDDADGSLECLSCRRSGETTHTAGQSPLYGRTDFKMSPDGSTIAFVTQEALLPVDVNGEVDVYEWRDGRITLITDGASLQMSAQLLSVDEKGNNIDFMTVQPGLTGFEADGLLNLYDARIDGGFMPPNPPEVCVEDACQGPLAASPLAASPGSASFAGANGNVGATPAPKTKPKSGSRFKRCGKRKARGRARGQRRCTKNHRRRTARREGTHRKEQRSLRRAK